MTPERSSGDGGRQADGRVLRGTVGSRLRRLRKDRGMTLTVLAASIQCSQSFISKVETGFLLPSLPMLQRLARALNTDIAALLGDGPTRDRR